MIGVVLADVAAVPQRPGGDGVHLVERRGGGGAVPAAHARADADGPAVGLGAAQVSRGRARRVSDLRVRAVRLPNDTKGT